MMEVKISYYGIEVSVPKEVAEFLEQDRKRMAAQRRQLSRHMEECHFNIVLDTYVQGSTDPVFEEATRNLRLERLRTAVATLKPKEQELIRLRFEEEMTLDDIGALYGVSKMAISKRLNNLLTKLRVSLIGRLSKNLGVYKSRATVLIF